MSEDDKIVNEYLSYISSLIEFEDHKFLLNQFLGTKTLQDLSINEIIELFYNIKTFRDNTYKQVCDPAEITPERYPKYYELMWANKYKKLYKFYPYEYLSNVISALGISIERYPNNSMKYLEIEEEIINRKS